MISTSLSNCKAGFIITQHGITKTTKKIEISSEKGNQILTTETLMFKTIVKNEIIQ
jgi:hypothetical protein